MRCGEVRRSSRPNKKIMKLYCLPGGKKKLVNLFPLQGYT